MTPRAIGTLIGWPGCAAIFVGRKLGVVLREFVGERRIEDCTKAKLHLAVTNLRTSRVELRTHGPLVETILASCALPGVIAPRRIDGELLWAERHREVSRNPICPRITDVPGWGKGARTPTIPRHGIAGAVRPIGGRASSVNSYNCAMNERPPRRIGSV